MMNKLDILAFGAHPDDVEISAAGTMLKQAKAGKTTGIIDLTKGEMGTRGTPEQRMVEAQNASKILGVTARECIGLRDGFIQNNEESQIKVIEMIRKYQPEIVLCNAPTDRHPDHGNASTLVRESCFKAGLRKIETKLNGENQAPWRPKILYMYIQYWDITPDVLVDITGFEQEKLTSILAYTSQFYNPNSSEPETVIASKGFKDSLLARTTEWGRQIYVDHAEGFLKERPLGVNLLTDLI